MAAKKTTEWITSAEAAAILTENSGHTISQAYVRRLALDDKIEVKRIDGRTKLYSKDDVKGYTVREKGEKAKMEPPSRGIF
jgi:hypothetical protein